MDRNNLPTRAEDMFCHAVYVASHMINRAYTPHLASLGLTYPQYITLTLLWEEDGQAVGKLASRLKMETSTLTPLLKRLESHGHVKRKRGKADERQVFVFLTKSGMELRSKAPKITACMIEATGLKVDELQALVDSLTTLTAGLEQNSPKRGN